MTNNTLNTNAIAAFDLGKEAARRWGLSVQHGEGGDANAIVALVHAQRLLTFTATVERKKEDTAESFDFDILSLPEPYWNADGSKDTRKMAARTAALAKRLFGIDELSNAIKTRLARCIKVAVYLINSLSHLSDDELINTVTIDKGKLSVPYGLVTNEPAEDASAKEKAVYQAMRDDPVALDGKDGLSLAELGKRANPPKASRAAASGNSDNGASFVASLDFVTAIVTQQLNEDADESDIALNSDVRRKLFSLSQQIAAYFAADPLEEEEAETVAA